MSVCLHDPNCPGSGPEHDEAWAASPLTHLDAEPVELPPLAELLEARIVLRKRAKSGNPQVKAQAVLEMNALERIISDVKAAEAKPEVPA
jgi:hypothetical protein